MNYKVTLLLLASAAIVACAGSPSSRPDTAAAPAQPAATEVAAAATTPAEEETVKVDTETSADDEDRVVCRTFMPTGSHRKKTICRTVGDIKRDRQSAQDALRRQQGSTLSAPTDN